VSSFRSRSAVNLWRIPLFLSLAGVALFGITMIPDTLDAFGVIHLPTWLTMGSIDDARAILSAMLSCVSTVLALIFSVALLVLSMVATLFGPRLLYRFLQDWVTQVTIGLFMATFVYLALVFLVTHQDEHTTFIPQISLITAWVLVVASFGFLVYYSHRIASSIQNPDLVARIVDDFEPAVARSHTHGEGEGPGESPTTAEVERQTASGARIKCVASGYLQEVDHAALVTAAKREKAVVHVLFRPGQFVLRGETLACVYPKERASALEPVLGDHIRLGRHRRMKDDVEFGIAQIVEIAIRALSPAINDTFTGVACVDWIADALLIAAEAPVSDGCWFDTNGELRVRVRPLHLERLVKAGFDQIRQAAADNPAVLVRILDHIGRIAPRVEGEARRALMDQVDAVRETAAAKITVKLDRADIDAALQKAISPHEIASSSL
jgi:uncharacterized membrane protein